MKKLNFVIAIFIVASLMLAACETADDGDGTPGFTDEPGVGLTETPEEVFTEEPTEMLETPATAEITETLVMTEEVQGTETPESTEMLPDTGFVDPGRATNLLDFDVWNNEDEQIGTTEDMIFNLDSRQVDYVLVEVGGFLGIGGKLVAVPYDRLEVVTAGDGETAEDEPQNAFILDASQEELESAPGFDPEVLPDIGEPAGDWDVDLSGYWEGGMTAATEESGTPEATEATDETSAMTTSELQGVVLATDILGITVQDDQGNDLAEVEDVIIDPQSGEIRYAAVEVSGIEDLDGQWMLIPLDHLNIDTENDLLVVTVDQATLAGAPAFEADQLPDTTAPDWDVDIESYWANQM